METRRHNGFGVDITGSGANLDATFAALNCYDEVLGALKSMIGVDNPPVGELGHIDPSESLEMGRAALRKVAEHAS